MMEQEPQAPAPGFLATEEARMRASLHPGCDYSFPFTVHMTPHGSSGSGPSQDLLPGEHVPCILAELAKMGWVGAVTGGTYPDGRKLSVPELLRYLRLERGEEAA
jgi:hypothetical protein